MVLRSLGALLAATAFFGVSRADVPELPPIPRDLTTPYGQRLAFNGPTGMSIGWNTFQQLAKPTVKYGLIPELLLHTASSSSSVTYNTSRTWSNTVQLHGLLPGTTYYYKISSTNSTVDSFVTARLAGDPTPFTAALVIDMGVFGPDGLSTRNASYSGKPITYPLKPTEHTTIQRLVADANTYDFVLHPGDFAYADAWLKELLLNYINGTVADGPAIYEGLNEQFFADLGAVTRMKPYMVTAGNHEANCVNGGTSGYTEAICPIGQTNFTSFVNRFGLVMPGSGESLAARGLQKRFGLDGMWEDGIEMLAQGPSEERKAKPRSRARSGSGASFADTKEHARRSAAASTTSKLGQALPPFWYSFDYGMAHFLVIDTETDFGVGLIAPDELGGGQKDLYDGNFASYADQQIDFIKQDINSVDRFVTPWLIVAGHRPWYASNGFLCPACQTAFEDMLVKGGVDLAVFGHTHNSQLIVPIAYNVTDPAGWNNPSAPAYIVQGAAGHFEGLESVLPTPPPYLAWANDTTYGFSKLLFKDRHNLELQFISSDTGEIMKSQVLTKEHKQRFFKL